MDSRGAQNSCVRPWNNPHNDKEQRHDGSGGEKRRNGDEEEGQGQGQFDDKNRDDNLQKAKVCLAVVSSLLLLLILIIIILNVSASSSSSSSSSGNPFPGQCGRRLETSNVRKGVIGGADAVGGEFPWHADFGKYKWPKNVCIGCPPLPPPSKKKKKCSSAP